MSQVNNNIATLRLHFTGMSHDNGVVRVALFTEANEFPSTEPQFAGEALVQQGRAIVEFAAIPFGTYAAAAFHDEQSLGALERNFFGIPTNPYGFSNNARQLFGPPSFDEAAFPVNEALCVQLIHLKDYL
jgi:uncharacterized protein (DUF2141 family)